MSEVEVDERIVRVHHEAGNAQDEPRKLDGVTNYHNPITREEFQLEDWRASAQCAKKRHNHLPAPEHRRAVHANATDPGAPANACRAAARSRAPPRS